MSQLPINTTQNVNVEFTLASVGSRILAQILDLVFKACYVIVLFIILDQFNSLNRLYWMDQWSYIAIVLILSIPVIFYTLFFEFIWKGQTPGKRILKIRVIKIDGFNAGFAEYLVRWLFRTIDTTIGNGIIGLLTIIFNPKNQRFGDLAAGTAVITLKQDISINQTILLKLQEDYKPLYPSVIRLSDNDIRIIKESFLASVRSKDYKTVSKLAQKIKDVTEIQETKQKDVDFVKTVLKDYTFFTQEM